MASPTVLPNAGHFRRVLGHHPTGVCVVAALGADGTPLGMTAGSFTSVSLDPPLVAFFPQAGSRVLAAITEVGRFAVNFLAGDQLELCRRFASRDDDKFRAVEWRTSPLGSPVLADAPAWIDCRLDRVLEIGDHLMVVGAVDTLDVERSVAPLIFLQGAFGSFTALSMVAEADDDLGVHLRLADLARPRLEEIAARFGVHTAAGALVDQQVIQLAWAGAELDTNLVGLRLPFMAPFGPVFAAWGTEEVRDEWLRVPGVQEVLRRELAAARERGWAAVPDHPAVREIEASIARVAADGRRSASVRELETRIAGFVRQYAALSRDRPRGVSVPVFDRAGRVVLALTAQRLPAMEPGRLHDCLHTLVAAGEQLTGALQASAR
ncbi:flavin reductase [Cryptosporangium sp. NPDC048952]|uniref:flavin reductase n=1 Tax=Cryptosporangium sp. NPDC048952 TaxID=3363961 RepID=UPI0037196ACE